MNLIGLDGQRIVIFGGASNTVNDPFTPEDSLYVLNLFNFEWSIPKISGKLPKSRLWHRANVVGKYMVVSFGKYDVLIYFVILCDYMNLNFIF